MPEQTIFGLKVDSCWLKAIFIPLMIAAATGVLIFIVLTVDGGSFDERLNTTKTIYDHLLVHRKGEAWNWLAELCDDFGPRLTGSDNLERATDHIVSTLRQDGFDVHTEPVPGLKYWKRGDDQALVLEPREHKLSILAIGGSSPGFAEAEVVVLTHLDQLSLPQVAGRIVVFNQEWTGYSNTVKYRTATKQVEENGAVGVLVRSVTPFSLFTPHTGAGALGASIPAACVTPEEAKMIARWYKRGKNIRIRMNITSSPQTDTVIGRNIVFDIKGREKPEEVIVFSGHLDSWDVGTGAVDDGGGMAAARDALLAIAQLASIDKAFAPKRTLRGIFWADEEQGYGGAKQYFADHFNRTGEKFFFVSESDQGAFRPLNYNAVLRFSGNKEQKNFFLKMLRVINDAGIPLSLSDDGPGSQGDAKFFAQEGIPSVHYVSDRGPEYYFQFHHTNADYVSVFEEGDLETVAAIWAILAHNLANLETWNDF